MNNSKISSTVLLRISGCFIFDVAVILAFFKVVGLFFIIAPGKSSFMLLVLLIGLLIFNASIILPSMLFKSIGIPYSASTVTVMLLYVIVANIISIFFITGSTAMYIVWELIIFACLLVVLSIICTFLKGAEENILKIEIEREDKTSVMLQLLQIEDTLNKKENEEYFLSIINLFKTLKERIKASTPFGRIIGNSSVFELENQIKNNLVSLQEGLETWLTDKKSIKLEKSFELNELIRLEKLIKDTRTLVINRETLNIK